MAKKPTYEELEKEAQDLRSREKRLKIKDDAVALSISAAGITDLKGRLIYVNNSCLKMWGYDNKNEMLGRPLQEFWEGDEIFNNIKELQEKGNASGEDIGKRKDGSLFTVQFSANIFKDESGNPAYMFGSFYDITERKRAEKTLRVSAQEWNGTFDAISDAVSTISPDGTIQKCNKAMINLVGKKFSEVIGRKCWELVHGTSEPIEGCPYQFMKVTLRRENNEFLISDRWFNVTVDPIFDVERNITSAVHILSDITERKRAEEERDKLEFQLRQTQKMEAIATLAGGIAHEFNNALTSIVGNIQLLEMDFADNKAVKKYTEAMMPSSHRMANLTSQLLAYARGGRYQDKTISLSIFVEDTLSIVKPSIGPSIHVDTDLPRDTFKVNVDSVQMQMVLSAVVRNSIEALEGDGRIRIITSSEEIDAEFAKSQPELTPGRYACLTVEDFGEGMDEATLNKIFDPFFTTKFMGRGLGMSAVYGIVKNHDGCISVNSELGKGTVVRIYLPAIEIEVKKKLAEPPPVEMPSGEGTILVIEDEEAVRNVIRDILDKLGYHMLEAKTGKEAIEIAKSFDGDIDLALLDIKLPDIRGDKVYPQIMEARPDLKVIVCSGFSIEAAQEILDDGAQGFIQKPFNVKGLSRILRETLEEE